MAIQGCVYTDIVIATGILIQISIANLSVGMESVRHLRQIWHRWQSCNNFSVHDQGFNVPVRQNYVARYDSYSWVFFKQIYW